MQGELLRACAAPASELRAPGRRRDFGPTRQGFGAVLSCGASGSDRKPKALAKAKAGAAKANAKIKALAAAAVLGGGGAGLGALLAARGRGV